MKKREFLIGVGATVCAMPPLNAWAQSGKNSTGKTPPRTLVFALITPRNAEQTQKSWAPFLADLSSHCGVTFEGRTYAQQAELTEDFKKGKIDFAWMGNAPAIDVVEANAGAVFAQLLVKGQSSYRSLIVVPQNSPLKNLDDIIASKGKYVFSDGDLRSTSGHIVPRYFAFVKKGVNDPDSLFKEVKRASHVDNLNRVSKQEVDLATNNTTELELFAQGNPELAKNIRVIWQSPDIPESPLVWRLTLPVVLRKKVQDFITMYGQTPAEKAVLKEMNNLTGFRKSSNKQLVTIADLEMFNARQTIVNDAKLSPEEREAKIQLVIKRGTKLELLLKRV